VGHTAGVINTLKNKVDLEVVSNDKLSEVDYPLDIVKPIYLPLIPKGFNELFYNLKIVRHCRDKTPDIIYQRYNGFSFCGAYLAKQKKVPFVLEFNSSNFWTIKHWKSSDSILKRFAKYFYNRILILPIVTLIENYNIKSASYIVVVSKALKKTLKSFGVSENKIIVAPNGIDETKYHQKVMCDDIKEKYDFKNKTVVGFIGTFGQWHGAENITLAYGKLLQRYPEYKNRTTLFMIGDGIKMPEVRKHVKDFNISENVVLTGLVPQSDGPKYLSACDILVNPTVPNSDGTEFFGSPTKLFEYMAMGKGIICSDMAQMAEILEHNRTAFMVKPGDVDKLMMAVKVLIDNRELREKMGQNARSEVITKYTWDKHVQKILARVRND